MINQNAKFSLNRERLLWFLIPLVSFLWFWYFRSNNWTGGDSEQWEREINHGVWLRKRQMLSFGAMQMVHVAGRALCGLSARLAINCASCLAGALSMLALWRMFRTGKGGGWAFLLAATAGWTTLFHGHIETYAMPVAALLLHFLAIQRVTENRAAPWTIPATFTLALAFHLVVLYLLPVTLAIVLRETYRLAPERRRTEWRRLLFATLPGLAFWFAITRLGAGDGELVGPHFIEPPGELLRRPWIILFDDMLLVKIRFMFWNGGVILPLALLVFVEAARRFRRDPLALYYAGYFVMFLVFTAIWNPDARDMDFDLFCFPWVVATVGVARRLERLPGRSFWAGLLLGVHFFLWLTRPVVFAEIGRRGTGTLLYENRLGDTNAIVLIDAWMPPRPVNRFVPEGSHVARVIIHARGLVMSRAIVMRPGKTVRVILDDAGLSVEKVEEEE